MAKTIRVLFVPLEAILNEVIGQVERCVKTVNVDATDYGYVVKGDDPPGLHTCWVYAYLTRLPRTPISQQNSKGVAGSATKMEVEWCGCSRHIDWLDDLVERYSSQLNVREPSPE